jgi:hypothetical protein
MITKEGFLCRLRSIVRRVTYMSEENFENLFKDGKLIIEHKIFGDGIQYHIEIKMKKPQQQELSNE